MLLYLATLCFQKDDLLLKPYLFCIVQQILNPFFFESKTLLNNYLRKSKRVMISKCVGPPVNHNRQWLQVARDKGVADVACKLKKGGAKKNWKLENRSKNSTAGSEGSPPNSLSVMFSVS